MSLWSQITVPNYKPACDRRQASIFQPGHGHPCCEPQKKAASSRGSTHGPASVPARVPEPQRRIRGCIFHSPGATNSSPQKPPPSSSLHNLLPATAFLNRSAPPPQIPQRIPFATRSALIDLTITLPHSYYIQCHHRKCTFSSMTNASAKQHASA
mmetsp:Transcript_16521/g.26717  ORF Transcript_16521/g.26717 Transcript_16521/m.26717 type:complete len:155 (-) Transcript_16521:62-526(-)